MANLLRRIESDLNDLSSFWRRPLSQTGRSLRALHEGFSAEMDVSEEEDQYLVKVDLPGIDPDEIDVSLSENTLTIKGEKREEEEVDEENFHRVERRFGSFSRQISLPDVDRDAEPEAVYRNGVLTLELPKDRNAKTKKISVKSEE